MENTTLYCREGSADKVYQTSLQPQEPRWVVTFAYGRRGSTLTTGTKTITPVPEAEARRIYARLITSKQAKGYTAGNDGIPYQNGSGRVTDIRPQLLNPVPEGKVEALLDDDSFVLQQKLDGRRLLILSNEDGITGINRRGMECGIPESIRTAAGSIAGTFVIDGEAVGDILHAFDLLERNGRDLRGLPYRDRLIELVDLIPAGGRSIGFVPVFFGGEKRRCFPRLQKEGAEGVVFKLLGARYIPGRPASGGDQLKYKFVETASVVVTDVNSQRSVAVGVFDNEGSFRRETSQSRRINLSPRGNKWRKSATCTQCRIAVPYTSPSISASVMTSSQVSACAHNSNTSRPEVQAVSKSKSRQRPQVFPAAFVVSTQQPERKP